MAVREWLKAHPPKDRGPIDPKNLSAGFRILEGAPKSLQRAGVDAGTARVWVVDIPNFLTAGGRWVSATDGTVLAVKQLIER